jgi:Flp pilus assembly protein TadG
MRAFLKLRSDSKGTSAIEFALLAPLLITFLIGITQLGFLFLANTGLKSAVGEGARLATIFPRPTDAQIIERITDRRFGLEPQYITNPTITPATAAQRTAMNGRDFLTIRMSYAVPLDFIFFTTPPITLVESRRVFVHRAATT